MLRRDLLKFFAALAVAPISSCVKSDEPNVLEGSWAMLGMQHSLKNGDLLFSTDNTELLVRPIDGSLTYTSRIDMDALPKTRGELGLEPEFNDIIDFHLLVVTENLDLEKFKKIKESPKFKLTTKTDGLYFILNEAYWTLINHNKQGDMESLEIEGLAKY